MSEITQEYIGSLISQIENAEEPESITNGMVAQVLDWLNSKVIPAETIVYLQTGATDGKHAMQQKGQPSGFATLDSAGKLTSAQLPAITSAMLPQVPASLLPFELRTHVCAFDGFEDLVPEQAFEQMGLSPMGAAKVHFSRSKGAFYCVKNAGSLTDRKVYCTWSGSSLMDASVAMGTEDSTRGVVPVTGKLYYCRADKAYYLWNGSSMQPELAAQEEYKERALIAEAETAGATWNAETRHFSLNGLTDITIDEMRKIIRWGAIDRYQCDAKYYNAPIRTNLPPTVVRDYGGGPDIGIHTNSIFCNSSVEVVNLGGNFCPVVEHPWDRTFCAPNLRKILGRMMFNYINTSALNDLNFPFFGAALEEVNIYWLNSDLNIGNCPNFSLASLTYMLQNKKDQEKVITITVHPTVYAKITDTTNTEWHALLDLAASKNVNIATTA